MASEAEERIAVLQRTVRERLADLRPLRPDTPEYAVAADAVIAATDALITYEQRVPDLLAEGPHRISLQVVRASGLVVTVVGVVLGIAAAVHLTARWWLLLAALVIAVGVALLRMRVPAPSGDHLAVRPGAAVAAAGGLVIGAGTATSAALWLAGAGTAVLVGGFTHAERAGGRR